MRSGKGWILAAPLPVTHGHCMHLSSTVLALPSHQVLNYWFKQWLSSSATLLQLTFSLQITQFCLLVSLDILTWRASFSQYWNLMDIHLGICCYVFAIYEKWEAFHDMKYSRRKLVNCVASWRNDLHDDPEGSRAQQERFLISSPRGGSLSIFVLPHFGGRDIYNNLHIVFRM